MPKSNALASLLAELLLQLAKLVTSKKPKKAQAPTATPADTQADAQAAGDRAGQEASEGWVSTAHRKRPRAPLILALCTGALAAPSRALAEDTLHTPSGTEAPGLEGCTAARAGADLPQGQGFWYERGRLYFCPCLTNLGRTGEAHRLPGGCTTPLDLEFVGYTVSDNAAMWSDIVRVSTEVETLRKDNALLRKGSDTKSRESQDTCSALPVWVTYTAGLLTGGVLVYFATK